MLFEWNEQSIRWFLDAGAYTGYHKALAQIIRRHLEPEDTLLDAGCGLGRLDLELAPYVKGITAVDINECALNALIVDIENADAGNINARCGDASVLNEDYDIILMSFFGEPDMPVFLEHCRRKIIRIVGAGTESGFYPQRYRRYKRPYAEDVRKELTALGVSFDMELCSIEFGQPLKSVKEAERYISFYTPEAEEQEIKDFLHQKLITTGRDDFPYYLPHNKELGIFVIKRSRFDEHI